MFKILLWPSVIKVCCSRRLYLNFFADRVCISSLRPKATLFKNVCNTSLGVARSGERNYVYIRHYVRLWSKDILLLLLLLLLFILLIILLVYCVHRTQHFLHNFDDVTLDLAWTFSTKWEGLSDFLSNFIDLLVILTNFIVVSSANILILALEQLTRSLI